MKYKTHKIENMASSDMQSADFFTVQECVCVQAGYDIIDAGGGPLRKPSDWAFF